MIDTKVKVNGKTVGEYDLINEPCVKKINGEGPDDNGNVAVETDGPAINGGYDVEELVTVLDTIIEPTHKNLVDGYKLFNFIGDTVHVTYDGVLYDCLVGGSRDLGYYYIGDSTFAEYPFYYADTVLGDNTSLKISDKSVSHTMKIEAYETKPVVFDRKYLPNAAVLTGAIADQTLAQKEHRVLMSDKNGTVRWQPLYALGNIPCVTFTSRNGGPYQAFINFDGSNGYDTIKAYLSRRVPMSAVYIAITEENTTGSGPETVHTRAEYKIYICYDITCYALPSEIKGIEFKFASLSDQTVLTLFYKENGYVVVEGNPNVTE